MDMEEKKKTSWKKEVLWTVLLVAVVCMIAVFLVQYLKTQNEKKQKEEQRAEQLTKEKAENFVAIYEQELESFFEYYMDDDCVEDLDVHLEPCSLQDYDEKGYHEADKYEFYYKLEFHSDSVIAGALRAEKSKKLSDGKAFIKKMRTLNHVCENKNLFKDFNDWLQNAYGDSFRWYDRTGDMGDCYWLNVDDQYEMNIYVKELPYSRLPITADNGDFYQMEESRTSCALEKNGFIIKKFERKNTDYDFWDKRCLKGTEEKEPADQGSGGRVPEVSSDNSKEDVTQNIHKHSSGKKHKYDEEDHDDYDYDNEEELYEDNRDEFDDEDDAADYLEDEWEE